ncbi:hypothetical protein E3N88_32354 [Mikania micrantha]|uniref:Uncharacterized protein n=1 Tax=Mikania micrantha TaxID=192012 RepID=A0A5N6M869_9ASTR|nr:hypothetical protein E3N88_32354 [Mikania micrantha]
MLQHLESTLIDRKNGKFIATHEESLFFDASETFDSELLLSVQIRSNPDNINQDFVSKLSVMPELQSVPFFTSLRRRRLFSPQNLKKFGFKNVSDGLADFEVHGSDGSSAESSKLSWNLKDDYKLNEPNWRFSEF